MHRQTDRERRTSLQWLKLKLLGTTVLVVEHWSEDYCPSWSRITPGEKSRPPPGWQPGDYGQTNSTDGHSTDGEEGRRRDEDNLDAHSRSETEMCNGELWSLGNKVFLSPLTHPLHQYPHYTAVHCGGEKLCYHKATEEGQTTEPWGPFSTITQINKPIVQYFGKHNHKATNHR